MWIKTAQVTYHCFFFGLVYISYHIRACTNQNREASYTIYYVTLVFFLWSDFTNRCLDIYITSRCLYITLRMICESRNIIIIVNPINIFLIICLQSFIDYFYYMQGNLWVFINFLFFFIFKQITLTEMLNFSCCQISQISSLIFFSKLTESH